MPVVCPSQQILLPTSKKDAFPPYPGEEEGETGAKGPHQGEVFNEAPAEGVWDEDSDLSTELPSDEFTSEDVESRSSDEEPGSLSAGTSTRSLPQLPEAEPEVPEAEETTEEVWGVKEDAPADEERSESTEEGAADGIADDGPEGAVEDDAAETCAHQDSTSLEASQMAATEPPTELTREETVLIFDWDDTFMPTTWLQLQGFGLSEEHQPTDIQWAELAVMAERGAETLETAKRLGAVVLITNAESGWIELSCERFLPTMVPSLEKVKILSARSTFEPLGVESPADWKFFAFERVIHEYARTFTPGRRGNFLSMGDSLHERDALIRTTAGLHCCAKSVKFIERPSVEQLAREHEVVSGCFQNIVDYVGNVDLCIG